MKKNKIAVNLFWFIVIAFVSFRMPYITDDYLHMNSFATGDEIGSFGMILPSVLTYYNTWGGRALSMVVIQSVLQLPKICYALMNAAVYVGIANLICLYGRTGAMAGGSESASGSEPASNSDLASNSGIASFSAHYDIVFSAACLLLWFFMPVMSEDMLWITGSITYLWMNLVILGFGYLYYVDFCRCKSAVAIAETSSAGTSDETSPAGTSSKSSLRTALRIIGMFLFGFCAGLSNESGACTLLLALGLYALWMLRNRHKIRADRMSGAVGAIVGCAVLLLAPGNFIRVSTVTSDRSAAPLYRILFRLGRVTYYGALYLIVPVFLCIALMLLAKKTKEALLFLALAFISAYMMAFSAGYANRILQFTLMLVTVGVAISLTALLSRIKDERTFFALRVFIAGLFLMVLVEVLSGVMVTRGNNSFFDRRMHYSFSLDELDDGMISDE